jgi:RimJ/RimL family protein N-acetyltransferase
MIVTETDRLIIRRLTLDDAEFILDLVNQPSFLHFIGDKGVRTLADAQQYLKNVPMASYEKHGFGSYCVVLKETQHPIGMSGLIKREELDRPDIGFSLLPDYWRQGYAFEAAQAIANYAKNTLKLDRLVAIANSNNEASIGLLQRLGFEYQRMVQIANDDREIKLFSKDL